MVEICSIDYTKQDERNLRMKGNSRDLNGTSKIFWTSERDMQFQKYFKIFLFVRSFDDSRPARVFPPQQVRYARSLFDIPVVTGTVIAN